MTATIDRPATTTTAAPEAELRSRLGIPDDAERVLVFTESSHWDPNWMLTSEQYFRLGVGRTLDLVVDELERDPRRVWSADCMFFVAMYWERRPAKRERFAALVNEGRIRLTSSGVTTQDTLLPTTESVLRDFLIGQEWLRARGMHQEPRLAYFPDSFGHAPSLPTLLRAAGFDRTLVTRIDGGYFLGADWDLPRNFPLPGSSAEALTAAGSADFVWRDTTGAEVLAHWHPYTYGHGDKLAAVGIMRYMSVPLTVPDRNEARVARRIERYARALTKLARTPYMLCPIGLDFVHPIRDLNGLLDRYNDTRYGDTGVWVVNAGADDYLEMVNAHRDELPVLTFDPNPYWTGFYSSRPELKRAHRRLGDELVTAEAEAVADGAAAAARTAAALAEPWWTTATANHHDFVTGTSPDRVVRNEQEPWLASALATVERHNGPTAPVTVDRGTATADWVDGVLHVTAGALAATVDPARGGCVTSLRVDGTTVLSGDGADLVAYDDAGGLWRMGGEYRGGHFRAVARTSDAPADVVVVDDGDSVRVEVTAVLDGHTTRRTYRFDARRSALLVDTECAAAPRRTVTLALPTATATGELTMDQPGGVVTRPAQRHFDPTFWPVSSWVADGDVALAVEMTRAVAAGADGTFEVIVARNAVKERAWGVLPIPACPARGSDPDVTTATVALWRPADTAVDALADATTALLADPLRARFDAAVARVVEVRRSGVGSTAGVDVIALKPADRGAGVVVRCVDRSYAGPTDLVLRTTAPLAAAALCDVRERDLSELDVRADGDGSVVTLRSDGPVVSIRLVPAT